MTFRLYHSIPDISIIFNQIAYLEASRAHHFHDPFWELQYSRIFHYPVVNNPQHQPGESYFEPTYESILMRSKVRINSPRMKYPKRQSNRPNEKHEIIARSRCSPPYSYSRSGSLEPLKLKAEMKCTGLKEARNNVGMATPHIFIRKKCQSRILCSRIVRDSWKVNYF